VLKSFSCEVTLEIKADYHIYTMRQVRGRFQGKRKREREASEAQASKPRSESDKQQSSRSATDEEASALPAPSDVEQFLVCSAGCDLFVISMRNWSQVHRVDDAHESEVEALEVMQAGGREVVVSAALDRLIRCWDADTWSCLFTLGGHTDAVLALCVMPTPEGSRLCSGSDDCTIQVWDVPKLVGEADTERSVSGACPSPPTTKQGKDTDDDEAGRVRSGPTFEAAEHVLKDHEDFVHGLCVVSAGGQDGASLMVSGSADFTVRVWDASWECVRVLDNSTYVLRFSTNSRTLFAATRTGADSDECAVVAWDVSDPSPLKWTVKPGVLKVPIPWILLTETVPTAFASNNKMPLIMTAAEDEMVVHVWSTPLPVTQEQVRHQAEEPQDASEMGFSLSGASRAVVTELPSDPPSIPAPRQQQQQQQQQLKQQQQPRPGATPHHPVIGPAIPGFAAASLTNGNAQAANVLPGHHLVQQTGSTNGGGPTGPGSGAVAAFDEATVSSGPVPGQHRAPAAGASQGAATASPGSGDALAKHFLRGVLGIPGLSPDMRRLLQVCVHLHAQE